MRQCARASEIAIAWFAGSTVDTIKSGVFPVSLIIDLPSDQQAALAAQAQAQGVSPEEYVRQVLTHALETAPSVRRRHISDVILENMRRVPAEIMATMPKDGASQHDHYVYGLPKRDL